MRYMQGGLNANLRLKLTKVSVSILTAFFTAKSVTHPRIDRVIPDKLQKSRLPMKAGLYYNPVLSLAYCQQLKIKHNRLSRLVQSRRRVLKRIRGHEEQKD